MLNDGRVEMLCCVSLSILAGGAILVSWLECDYDVYHHGLAR